MKIPFLKSNFKRFFFTIVYLMLLILLIRRYQKPEQTAFKLFLNLGNNEDDFDGILRRHDLKHWIVCLFEECNSSTSTYHQWTFLCVHRNQRIQIFHKGELVTQIESLKHEKVHKLELLNYFYVAVKNGAETIFLAENESDLKDNSQRLHTIRLKNLPQLEMSEGVDQFNSSLYFGCESLSVSEAFDNNHTRPLLCTNRFLPGLSTPALIHSHSSHCKPIMPDIALSANYLVPIIFSASFFSQCAFPFLPLTQLTNQPEHYSCLVQHLLAQVGCHVSVHWAGVREGKQLDLKKCQEVIKILPKCDFVDTKCFSSEFQSILSPKHISYFEEWFESLDKLKIKFMKILNRTKVCFPTILNPFAPFKNQSKVPIENLNLSENLYFNICTGGNYSYDLQNVSNPWYQRPNILLLIGFNYPYFELISLIEIYYRPNYPNIIYCAERLPNKTEMAGYKVTFVTFYNAGFTPGHLIYQCTIKVIELKLNFDGIFFVSDDILFKSNVSTLPTNKVWFPSRNMIADMKLKTSCSYGKCSANIDWKQWNYGQLKSVYDRWISLGLKDKEMETYRRRLINFTGGEYRFVGNTGDTYYIPNNLFYSFHKLASFFSKERLFLEVATASVVFSIMPPNDIVDYKGHGDWSGHRMYAWKLFNWHWKKDIYYIHPNKLKAIFSGEPRRVDYFCRCLVPYVFDPNGFVNQHCGEPEKLKRHIN